MELETSGLTMGLLSTFSSATLPWGTGKWLSPEVEHPLSPKAADQRAKSELLLLLVFLPQGNVDMHLLTMTINEYFYLDRLL